MFAQEFFNPSNWYWFVGDDKKQVWSSSRAKYVDVDDADYLAWLKNENATTLQAAEESSLVRFLNMVYPDGSPARSFSPSQIVAGLKSIDPAKASAILAAADPLTAMEFQAALAVRLDDARLKTALDAVSISTDELKNAILNEDNQAA